MGRFWQTDKKGYLLNDCKHEYLQPPFAAVLNDVVAAYTRNIEADLHSIYISGLIPRGLAVAGDAAIEMFGVLEYHVDPELVMQDWLPEAKQRIKTAHDSVTDVQLELLPQGYIFRNPEEFSPGAFKIATHALCVWGSDLTPELPRYTLRHRPTRLAIANDDIFNMLPDIQEAIAEIETNPAAEHVRYWCKRICKNIVSTGFSLVMEQVQHYTRDVDIATEQFCHYYPAQTAQMQQAYHLIHQPTQDAKTLLSFLETFGDWMIERCEDWLTFYNPEQHEFFVFDEDDIE